jgi:hypothetical protein
LVDRFQKERKKGRKKKERKINHFTPQMAVNVYTQP